MRLRIPEPGDEYQRWDGVPILVTALTIDEEGTLCVEFEVLDGGGMSEFLGAGEWLGVARDSELRVPPPRYTFVGSSRPEPVPYEPSRSTKQAVLDKALEGEPKVPTVGG